MVDEDDQADEGDATSGSSSSGGMSPFGLSPASARALAGWAEDLRKQQEMIAKAIMPPKILIDPKWRTQFADPLASTREALSRSLTQSLYRNQMADFAALVPKQPAWSGMTPETTAALARLSARTTLTTMPSLNFARQLARDPDAVEVSTETLDAFAEALDQDPDVSAALDEAAEALARDNGSWLTSQAARRILVLSVFLSAWAAYVVLLIVMRGHGAPDVAADALGSSGFGPRDVADAAGKAHDRFVERRQEAEDPPKEGEPTT